MKISRNCQDYTAKTSDPCILKALMLEEAAAICGGAAPPAKPPTELLPPPMTEPKTLRDLLQDRYAEIEKALEQLNKENDMKRK